MWDEIDLGPGDRSHIQARTRAVDGVRYAYADGSDHWIDWVHHVVPGAKAREEAAGWELAKRILAWGIPERFVVGGHSLGAAVMTVAATYLVNYAPTECMVYGGKRSPVVYENIQAFRHSGDYIPWLFVLRPAYKNQVFGKWLPPWQAHEPREYYPLMVEHGLK